MGFSRVSDIGSAAIENGQTHTAFIHKNSIPALTAAGYWADMSIGAGIPKYNAYLGDQCTATVMTGVGNAGIFTGGNVSPLTKHILNIGIHSPLSTIFPGEFYLLDYLMFYPLIDMDSTDQQALDNTNTLTRYTDGVGVRLMVVTTIPQTATAVMQINYTNTADVQQTVNISVGTCNIGNINCTQLIGTPAGSNQTPFVPLLAGDKGIKSVQSVQLTSSAGGFASLVLVKPLARLILREQSTATEINFLMQHAALPRVYDGAYLNFIYTSGQATTSGIFRGNVDFIWG